MSAEYTKQLEQVLRPITSRLRQVELRPQLVRALFLGAAVALVPAVLRLVTGNLLWAAVAVLVLFGFPLVALGRALAAKPDLRRAALAVDKHYDWQDRITTAWSALSVGGLTPLEQYQAADAARRVAQVVPAEVVPLKVPSGIPKAGSLALVVVCALVWPILYAGKTVVRPVDSPAQAAGKPEAAPTVPAVSPELAVASFRQIRDSSDVGWTSSPSRRTGGPSHDSHDAPAPYRRLIHDYFEAVCPGR